MDQTLQTLVIDASTLLQGASLNTYTADAGYSPLSKGINHLRTRGVLNFQPTSVDLTALAPLDGELVAAVQDPNFLSNAAYLLTSAGSLYTLDGGLSTTSLTLRQTDSTAGHDYSMGTSDMENYQGGLYVSSAVDIMLATGSNLTTVDKSWWVTTKGKSPLTNYFRHPIVVIEDRLYFADGNYINTWDGTTAVEHDIVLPPNFNITAMNKHPNGRDLIAFCAGVVGYSNTYQAPGAAFIINTVTGEFTQQINIDDQVEGAKLVGGILYVVYGMKLGYFTDTGIVFLRDIDFDLPLFGRDIGYKHHLGNMEGHLLLVEKNNILALGDLGAGKVWWYPTSSIYGNRIESLLFIGSKILIYGSMDQANHHCLFKQDFSGSASTGGTFYTNKYDLGKKAWVRRIEIEHETYSSGLSLNVSGIDPNNNSTFLGSTSYTNQGGISFSRIDCNYYTGMIQLAIQAAGRVGIKKITIYYEYGEM